MIIDLAAILIIALALAALVCCPVAWMIYEIRLRRHVAGLYDPGHGRRVDDRRRREVARPARDRETSR